jgi:hypothetical protein
MKADRHLSRPDPHGYGATELVAKSKFALS